MSEGYLVSLWYLLRSIILQIPRELKAVIDLVLTWGHFPFFTTEAGTPRTTILHIPIPIFTCFHPTCQETKPSVLLVVGPHFHNNCCFKMVASKMLSDLTNSLTVPTVFEKPTVTVNIRGMTSSDLDALKSADPFLYHSIHASVTSNETAADSPQEIRSSESEVTRKTRFSFESHPDMLMEEYFAAAMAPGENFDSSDLATEPISTRDAPIEPNMDQVLSYQDFNARLGSSDIATEPISTENDLYDRFLDQVLEDLVGPMFTRDGE